MKLSVQTIASNWEPRFIFSERRRRLLVFLPYILFLISFSVSSEILLHTLDVNKFGWKSYLISLAIPGCITTLVGYAILSCFFVPVGLNKEETQNKDQEADHSLPINWRLIDFSLFWSLFFISFIFLKI